MKLRAALTVTAASALLLASCGGGDTSSTAASSASLSSSSSSSAQQQTLTVFAAASLKTTFTQLGKQFETAHPGTTVKFNFAGSSDLVTQITEGAPADVFASADEKNMAKATDASLTEGQPVNFATNVLEIATPAGNPAKVTSLADLAKPGLKVVLCAPQVPCGAAAAKVEQAAGVDIKPVSEENSVTDVLGKVTSGEADAGLVYVTDVTTAGSQVSGVTFPESAQAVNTYPIVALKDAADASLAKEFITYVTSTEGQSVLSAAGFGKPSGS